ncbi:MAG: hypothetical protein H6839_13840 [Planctomycetes bacterium]|nr:hypothetical protein [Planctomycetota bacterium]
MRRIAYLSAVLLLLALNSSGRATADPQPEPAAEAGGPTDERPFLETEPDWATAWALVGDAIAGDEDAVDEVNAGRLTYVPILSGRLRGNDWPYRLLRADIDWVRAMQGWEVLLMRTDTAAVLKGYKELKKRFRNPDPQLCRAILHAWRCGDPAAMDALVKLDPENDWVQAALAWTGERYSEKESAEKLIAIMVPAVDCGRWIMLPEPARLLSDSERPDQRDLDENIQATLNLLGSPDIIRQMELVPKEFKDGGLSERIGALAADAGDAETISALRLKFEEAIPEAMNRQTAIDTFALNASIDTADFSTVDRQFFISNAYIAKGTSLISYSVYALPKEQESERVCATIMAFAGMPRRTISQRALMARSLEVGDETLTRLSARAILALDGDSLDAYRNILRAFYRADAMPELRKQYQDALRASGNDELKALADMVKDGKWEVLNPRDRRRLELSDAQKAALVAVFSNEDERKYHGGALAVYWLNRAVFEEGQRAVVAAGKDYIRAIAAAGGPGKQMTPNVYEYLMFRLRNLDDLTRPAHDAMLKAQGEEFAKALLELERKFQDADAGVEFNAALQAWRKSFAHDGTPEPELLEELEKHSERWGGAGLAEAARQALRANENEKMADLATKSLQASPLDFDVHYRMMPHNEMPGTAMLCNWEAISRATWRLSLLHPTCMQTPAYYNTLALRSGQPGWSICAALQIAQTRPPYLFWGETDFDSIVYAVFARYPNWRNLLRFSTVSWDRMDANARDIMRQVFWSASFMHNAYSFMDVVRYFGGPSLEYQLNQVNSCIAAYNMRDVNVLLDMARHMGRVDPKRAIEFVETADKIGVSRYGRFVGTQTWVEAHGRLGTLSGEWDRYDDMRGDDVGVPRYLDSFMLSGITGGNQYQLLDKAIEKITKYGIEPDDAYLPFFWRRAHMAVGKYAEVRKLPTGPEARNFAYESAVPYTRLFHEARGILDAGSFDLLAYRTEPWLVDCIEGSAGVYADAAILRALAWKEIDQEDMDPFQCVEKSTVLRMPERARVLDCLVMETLAGMRAAKDLPAADEGHYWHGARWCERVPGFNGGGRITPAEVGARDSYMRGMLAYLSGNSEEARKQLQACIEADQRCSHEYHVAQWVLTNRLKEEKEKEK